MYSWHRMTPQWRFLQSEQEQLVREAQGLHQVSAGHALSMPVCLCICSSIALPAHLLLRLPAPSFIHVFVCLNVCSPNCKKNKKTERLRGKSCSKSSSCFTHASSGSAQHPRGGVGGRGGGDGRGHMVPSSLPAAMRHAFSKPWQQQHACWHTQKANWQYMWNMGAATTLSTRAPAA